MQGLPPPYIIYSLGDMALTIDFGNKIDYTINKYVITIFEKLKQLALPFVLDTVPAYSSLTIYYDVKKVLNHTHEYNTAFEAMSVLIENVAASVEHVQGKAASHLKIPVCYEAGYSPDLASLADARGVTREEIIQIHTSEIYQVYMIGFLPGFPYMGQVDERIAMPRKEQPRLKVEKGSIGIAGRQTGIYPLASPGGWQIIGRTPISLFDTGSKTPTLLKPGDSVQFYSITKDEFAHYKSRIA